MLKIFPKAIEKLLDEPYKGFLKLIFYVMKGLSLKTSYGIKKIVALKEMYKNTSSIKNELLKSQQILNMENEL